MEVQDLPQHSKIDEYSENVNVENTEDNSPQLESFDSSEKNDDDDHDESKKSDTPKAKLKPFRIEDETPRLTDEDGWLDILGSNDLKKRVIESGVGLESRPQRGDWIVIDATGELEDGTVVEKYDNMTVIVGDSDIVQGLDLTVTLMEKGELAEVIVPARLAYGEQGKLPEIPPNSVINYKIRLVDVRSEEEENLSVDQRIQIGDEKRDRGNFWYERGDFSTAVHCYRRALDFLDYDEGQNFQKPTDDEFEKLVSIRIKVYNNLAAAQLKMDAYEAAIKSVNNVLAIEPKNVKALFRKGKILAAQGQLDEAIDVMKQALQIEPERKIIHQELSKLTSKRKQEETQAKAMYKKMFKCNMEPQTKSKVKKSWVSSNWSMVLGGIFTIVCGIAVYKHFNSSE
ncbi:peptidyl-prolyl cis-trans isomerase FKBP8 [Centruroides vittatus]|uniref:peptidyl-prolyl cis-trans isomerase FKBP8 n=1 Tax=Centruroides vittatus TaxID=120091 RepID=UPI00350F1A80